MKSRTIIALVVAALLLMAGCSSNGDDSSTSDGASDQAESGATGADSNDGDDTSGDQSGSGGGGTLELDGSTIELTASRCYLEEQEAAGGGTILFTAQADGTDASGEQLLLDTSRFDEDSVIAGDSISISFGDPASPDAHSLSTIPGAELAVLEKDGSTVQADGVELIDDDTGEPKTVSFRIDC